MTYRNAHFTIGCIYLGERARPRVQQAPRAPKRWIFTDTPLALNADAPEDGALR
jgi:hypothetical protein